MQMLILVQQQLSTQVKFSLIHNRSRKQSKWLTVKWNNSEKIDFILVIETESINYNSNSRKLESMMINKFINHNSDNHMEVLQTEQTITKEMIKESVHLRSVQQRLEVVQEQSIMIAVMQQVDRLWLKFQQFMRKDQDQFLINLDKQTKISIMEFIIMHQWIQYT